MGEPTPSPKPPPDEWASFLMEDYKQKVTYLTGQFTRMWSRFQYFLAFEGVLSTAFFGFIKNGEQATDSDAVWVAVTGAVVAACWYVFGAQDKYLVEAYRSQVRYVLHQLFELKRFSVPLCFDEPARNEHPMRNDETTTPCYPFTGGTDTWGDVRQGGRCWRGLCWRNDYFSITYLAAGFPVVVFVFWMIWVAVLLWP